MQTGEGAEEMVEDFFKHWKSYNPRTRGISREISNNIFARRNLYFGIILNIKIILGKFISMVAVIVLALFMCHW
jgi:hypothetical protein